MSNIKRAEEIARKYHKGQTDKAGREYIHHPIHVASRMTDEKSKIVALLHDVLEDCNISPEELQKEGGFSDENMDSLKAMTHRLGESYEEYVRRLGENRIARKVKLADLEHNSDLSRLKEVKEKDLQRIEKYKRARAYLHSLDKD